MSSSKNALTETLIKKAAGEYDMEAVQILELPRRQLSALGGLDACGSLLELSLPYNAIDSICGLGSLRKLVRLDLSFNRITRIGIKKGAKDSICDFCTSILFQRARNPWRPFLCVRKPRLP